MASFKRAKSGIKQNQTVHDEEVRANILQKLQQTQSISCMNNTMCTMDSRGPDKQRLSTMQHIEESTQQQVHVPQLPT